MVWDLLVVLITGTASKSVHGITLGLFFGLYLGLFLIAKRKYPGPYEFRKREISDLGSIEMNPAGRKYFDLGCILIGLTMIPHFLYYHLRLVNPLMWFSWLGLSISWVGCLGFAGIGVFSLENDRPHYLCAYCGFFGLMFGAGIIGIIKLGLLIQDFTQNGGWGTLIGLLLLFLPLLIYLGILIRHLVQQVRNGEWIGVKGIWEWTLLIFATITIVGLWFVI